MADDGSARETRLFLPVIQLLVWRNASDRETVMTTITINEVGLRDGLQSLQVIMPTAAKRRWIDAAYGAGVRHMEVASFVPARLLPQMADAREVVAHALTYPDLQVTVLAPNLRGARDARIGCTPHRRPGIGEHGAQPGQRAPHASGDGRGTGAHVPAAY